MSLHKTLRTIGESTAACCDCAWIWLRRGATENTGQKGSRNAVMAATQHGRTKGHRVIVTRETHHDYRPCTAKGTAKTSTAIVSDSRGGT